MQRTKLSRRRERYGRAASQANRRWKHLPLEASRVLKRWAGSNRLRPIGQHQPAPAPPAQSIRKRAGICRTNRLRAIHRSISVSHARQSIASPGKTATTSRRHGGWSGNFSTPEKNLAARYQLAVPKGFTFRNWDGNSNFPDYTCRPGEGRRNWPLRPREKKRRCRLGELLQVF